MDIIIFKSYMTETKNMWLTLGVLALAGIGVWFVVSDQGVVIDESTVTPSVESTMPVPGSNTSEVVVTTSSKEFTMNAYYDDAGKWFSLKEMAVKKGDTVRIKVTNIKGVHDFVIDELGIKKDLPLDTEVVIEFTADKVGDFIYYCSQPGHRAAGQWGTLKVAE